MDEQSDDEVEGIGKIVKNIKKKYDDDQENWKVMGGTDKEGNHDLIISQNPNAWWLKSKSIDPYRSITFGKELRNIEDDIQSQMGKKEFDPNDAFHALFGMSVPVEKDLITALGIQKVAPKEMSYLKRNIEDKNPSLDKKLNSKVKKTWKELYPDRDNVYL